jgi:signal transduction histidine kinase
MKLGNQGQAKEYLAKFDREKKDDSAYSRHAMCLIQIVRFQLLQDQNLSPCVARADQELGLYIPFVTRELSQLALSKEMELTMWRQYQRYMETKLLPGLQMAFDQGTNEIEVETARMEALLQKEKAQNLQQYERYTQIMLLFSLGLCTLVGLLVWFFRKLQRNHRQLAEKKKEIEQLNRIIEAENVSIQKAMRLEIESKFNLASDAAHRLNNPLNYIHVGAELLLQKARTVAREIDEIFKNVDGNNPESKQLIQHFRNHLDEAETASQSLRLGVSQAIESVMEIRGLAGVDGYKVEPLSLLVLLEEALARLADHLGADAAHFVRYSAQEWSQLKIEGNRYLMKNALEIFLRRIVEKEHRDVRIGLGTEIDKSHFVITVEGLQEGKEDEQWLDVEDRLNYLLHNLNIKVRITKNSEEISMHWMSSQTLLIFQQNTDQPLKNLA